MNKTDNKIDISYDYYKIFYEVAKRKNITLAAQHLCLTQPTISKCIQNLEHDLECQLFYRSQPRVPADGTRQKYAAGICRRTKRQN